MNGRDSFVRYRCSAADQQVRLAPAEVAPVAASLRAGRCLQSILPKVALELWAAAHRVASLCVSRPYLPWGDIEEFADRVMTAACWGHIMSAGAASQRT